jgi:transcriptional regulator with XRE-family HTH domain
VIKNIKTQKSLQALANRIESLRLRKKIQQKTLITESGISRSTYARLISDDNQGVSIGALFSVLNALDVLDAVVAAIPNQEISPIQVINNQGKVPKRIKLKASETQLSPKDENVKW